MVVTSLPTTSWNNLLISKIEKDVSVDRWMNSFGFFISGVQYLGITARTCCWVCTLTATMHMTSRDDLCAGAASQPASHACMHSAANSIRSHACMFSKLNPLFIVELNSYSNSKPLIQYFNWTIMRFLSI